MTEENINTSVLIVNIILGVRLSFKAYPVVTLVGATHSASLVLSAFSHTVLQSHTSGLAGKTSTVSDITLNNANRALTR